MATAFRPLTTNSPFAMSIAGNRNDTKFARVLSRTTNRSRCSTALTIVCNQTDSTSTAVSLSTACKLSLPVNRGSNCVRSKGITVEPFSDPAKVSCLPPSGDCTTQRIPSGCVMSPMYVPTETRSSGLSAAIQGRSKSNEVGVLDNLSR